MTVSDLVSFIEENIKSNVISSDTEIILSNSKINDENSELFNPSLAISNNPNTSKNSKVLCFNSEKRIPTEYSDNSPTKKYGTGYSNVTTSMDLNRNKLTFLVLSKKIKDLKKYVARLKVEIDYYDRKNERLRKQTIKRQNKKFREREKLRQKMHEQAVKEYNEKIRKLEELQKEMNADYYPELCY